MHGLTFSGVMLDTPDGSISTDGLSVRGGLVLSVLAHSAVEGITIKNLLDR